MTGKYTRLTLLAIVFATQLLMQGDRGEITGRETDSSGAAVLGARATVVQKGTNASYKSATSSAGDFTVPCLPAPLR